MQITSAMKMVSAAKLKKAQDAITAMRPYADKLTELLQSLSATLDADSGSKFADQPVINQTKNGAHPAQSRRGNNIELMGYQYTRNACCPNSVSIV